MCVQCMMGAVAAGTATTGMRGWLAHRRPSWLGPQRLRAATAVLVGAGLLLAAGVLDTL